MSIQDPAVAESASTLRRLIMGFRATQLVHVAAKLGLADLLQDDPQPPHQAQVLGSEPQALHRLLRALVSLGLFDRDGQRRVRTHPDGSASPD